MKIKDYLHFANINKKDFSRMSGVCEPTLYNMIRGGNCTLYNAAKVVFATRGVVTYEDLLPEDLLESFNKDKVQQHDSPTQLKLPSNEELLENARKARWDSKFTGMCC